MVPGLEEAPLGDKEMGQAVTDLVFYTPQPDLPIVRKDPVPQFTGLIDEIRLDIFKFVLVDKDGIKPCRSDRDDNGNVDDSCNRFLNVFLVNRQFYREAKYVAYKYNVFHFNSVLALTFFATGYDQPIESRPDLLTKIVLTIDTTTNYHDHRAFAKLICSERYEAMYREKRVHDNIEQVFEKIPKLTEIKLHAKFDTLSFNRTGTMRSGTRVVPPRVDIKERDFTIYLMKPKHKLPLAFLPVPVDLRAQLCPPKNGRMTVICQKRWQSQLWEIRERRMIATEVEVIKSMADASSEERIAKFLALEQEICFARDKRADLEKKIHFLRTRGGKYISCYI